MIVKDYFLKYVTFDTRSDEKTTAKPSTSGQRIFAEYLVNQLIKIGMQDVSIDNHCYVMATLPATCNAKVPIVGFIAHLDTSPDMSGKDVKPQVIDYKGGDIILNEEQNIVLSPKIFPELDNYKDQELIVTDGTTLLGADDKAGIAAIVAAMKYLLDNKDIKHGKIRIAFTPDEEIGRGADGFNIEKFGCDWAYTVDGGAIGEFEYENFNAAVATVLIKGLNVHPGTAKGKMKNAIKYGMLFHSRLPKDMCPEKTSGYHGFYHPISFEGTVEKATLTYLIRDHNNVKFESMKRLLLIFAEKFQHRGIDIQIDIKDQYRNMREKIEPHGKIIDIACEAMRKCGVEPKIKPIRGGTDGAQLSFKGLPCPNIFTGGLNYHGRYEFIPVKSLEKSSETIIEIIQSLIL
ncbi:MAG: peptidase T [Tannerella sp.]|jgi:tripeptide aminopeptidase|nr:peptidase T [Tannerella sp.]